MQPLAIAPEYVPGKHGAHVKEPFDACVPAAHGDFALVPSHACPGGHGLQLVRVVLSPPAVNEPGGQALQPVAPSPLYWASPPHAEQILAPAIAKKPAVHFSAMLVPSQA